MIKKEAFETQQKLTTTSQNFRLSNNTTDTDKWWVQLLQQLHAKIKTQNAISLFFDSEMNLDKFSSRYYWLQEIQHIPIYNDVTDWQITIITECISMEEGKLKTYKNLKDNKPHKLQRTQYVDIVAHVIDEMYYRYLYMS